jgi:hypothetical protein
MLRLLVFPNGNTADTGFILNLAPQVSARLAQCYFNYKPDLPVGGNPR